MRLFINLETNELVFSNDMYNAFGDVYIEEEFVDTKMPLCDVPQFKEITNPMDTKVFMTWCNQNGLETNSGKNLQKYIKLIGE